ncbi:MAG: hypothetical protein L3J02_02650 [Henriciella sp.]|nr:hypothetical protein [Henriciella sp.]
MPTVKVPNWFFHTTVISKALDLLDFSISSKDQDSLHSFLKVESDLALEESRDSLRALIDTLRVLESDQNRIRCK